MSLPFPSALVPASSSPVDRELSALIDTSSRVEKLPIPAAFRVVGKSEGLQVVIFGSIHGDEPAGYLAIKELLTQFASGELQLQRGFLTLAVGNELGLDRGVREVEHNLNRLFKPDLKSPPRCYEERRAEELKGLLEGAAYMLDLHATSEPTRPFIMCEAPVLEEAREMGFARIVMGWSDLGDETLGGDTESYFNSIGGKGFTLESGQRDAADGPVNAIDAARRFLSHTGLLAYEAGGDDRPAVYKLFTSIKVDEPTFRYSRPFSSFDELAEGELIGSDIGKVHHAPEECVVIMPSKKEFMLARRVQ
jgi:succinylglutamate desuccinylase